MNVLVTGATGLVGSRLAKLLLERGDTVRLLVRDPSRAQSLRDAGAELTQGDLRRPQQIRPAVEEAEVVYHCAAQVALPYEGDRTKILQTNVEGTANLLDACAKAGIRRFVLASSVAVYGETTEENVTEDHPIQPSGPYAESKALAERVVQNYAGDFETVLVRPCIIYGPGDRNFLPMFFEKLPNGFLPLVSGGHQLLDMVYTSDVAQALMLAGTVDGIAGEAYNVTDGERHTVRELFELFGSLSRRRLRTVSVPYPLAYGLASLSTAWQKFRKPNAEPLVTPESVRVLTYPHHYDISKIRRELGFAPQVPIDDGMRRTVEWYLEQHTQNGGSNGFEHHVG